MAETTHEHDYGIPENSYSIAFILDGIVQDVLHMDARLAALMLSEPEIIEVTEWYEAREDKTKNLVGATYANGGFALPENIEATSKVGESIAPRMHPSFVWNNELQTWEPPIPYPSDDKNYRWDEDTISWVEIEADLETIIQGMEQA